MKNSILLGLLFLLSLQLSYAQSADLRTSSSTSWLSLSGASGGNDDVGIYLNRSDDDENAFIRYNMNSVPGIFILSPGKYWENGMFGSENFFLRSNVQTGIFPSFVNNYKYHLFCDYDGGSYLNGVTYNGLLLDGSWRFLANDTKVTMGLNTTKRGYINLHHEFGAPDGGITFENNGPSSGTDNNRYWTWYVVNGSGVMNLYYSTSIVGTFATSGTYTVSDRRLKNKITDLDDILEKVNQLEPKTYIYKSDPMQKKTVGLIAQEVKSIFPELVIDSFSDDKDDTTHALNYPALGVIVIKAIQEQQEIIEAQKKELDALKTRLDRIEQLLEK